MTTPQSSDAQPGSEATGRTPTERFLAFHRRNPDVYATLKRLAFEYLSRGKSKCGIELLWNTCRWELTMAIAGEDIFELNNDHKPFYARALMHFEPELAGLFNVRRSAEADAWIAQYQDEAAA